MASHYSLKATVSEAELSIPAAQTFLERSEGSYREGERGEMGMLNPRWCQSESTVGEHDSVEVNQKVLSSHCIMFIQYIRGCSVHRGVQYIGGVQYIRGIS